MSDDIWLIDFDYVDGCFQFYIFIFSDSNRYSLKKKLALKPRVASVFTRFFL